MTKLVIIGSGLAGKLAVLYFSHYIEDIELVVIDPQIQPTDRR
jgi:NADH dehydrogenase FAD-containing subunit